MQFWTNELIAVIVLGLMGFILLAIAMPMLQHARGIKQIKTNEYVRGSEYVTEFAEKILPGQRVTLYIITSTLVIMVGAIGVLLFAFDIWSMPMYVNIMDVNVMFIFTIFAIFTFMIAMSIAGLYVYSGGSGKR